MRLEGIDSTWMHSKETKYWGVFFSYVFYSVFFPFLLLMSTFFYCVISTLLQHIHWPGILILCSSSFFFTYYFRFTSISIFRFTIISRCFLLLILIHIDSSHWQQTWCSVLLSEGLLQFFFYFIFLFGSSMPRNQFCTKMERKTQVIQEIMKLCIYLWFVRFFFLLCLRVPTPRTLHGSRTPHFIRVFFSSHSVNLNSRKWKFTVFTLNHDEDVWHPRSRQLWPQNDNSPHFNIIRSISSFCDTADSNIHLNVKKPTIC